MKTTRFLIGALMMLLPLSAMAQKPSTICYDAQKLAKAKAQATEDPYKRPLKSLKKKAEEMLAFKTPTVMDKKMVPASGDKHDYLSMGPYWWPDPAQPDGKPYIRRDGERNPELVQLDHDKVGDMAKAVTTLGLAYYFYGDDAYAEKAAEILSIWFLNEDTKMNPHLEYGQMIPGRNGDKGRAEGVLDLYCFIPMLDAISLMQDTKPIKKITPELKDWFSKMVEWLKTSDIGNGERSAKNNHGISFDVQLAAFSIYIGDKATAKQLIKEFPEKRIFKQIEPDGKQPLELARTTSFHYTLFNLVHMLDMCDIAKNLGLKLFDSTSADGRNMRKAIDFFVPYMGKQKSDWPWQQLANWEKEQEVGVWLLRRAASYAPKAGYLKVSQDNYKGSLTKREFILY